MSYWFGCRVFEVGIDLEPGRWQLEGPYASSQEAKTAQADAREPGLKVSEVFTAQSSSEAMKLLELDSR